MEQLATPGSTRLTGETLRLAEGFVQVVPIGPIPVKGLAGPVEVFELVGAVGDAHAPQAAAARGLTRFVGRTQELDHLRQALDTGARRLRGRSSPWWASPGSASRACSGSSSTRTGPRTGSCSSRAPSPMARPAPICPSSISARATSGSRRATTPQIREKVTGKLLTLDESLRAMVPGFLSLLDVPTDDASWEPSTPGSAAGGPRRPAADAAPREPDPAAVPGIRGPPLGRCRDPGLLDALVEGLPTARLLLLVNYRPEYSHGWGSKTYYSQLRLDPLPPESAESCSARCSARTTTLEPLKRLLVERTEGVPFFLEESVRTLVETGALAGERGAYRLARPFETIQVPATVQAILAARIDRLPPRTRPCSRRRPSSARTCRSRCCRPSPTPRRRRSARASDASRPPSSCTRPPSSPSWSTRSSTR